MKKYKLTVDNYKTAIITIRNKREAKIITHLKHCIRKINELEYTDEMLQYYRNDLDSTLTTLYYMDIASEPITTLTADNAKLIALYE